MSRQLGIEDLLAAFMNPRNDHPGRKTHPDWESAGGSRGRRRKRGGSGRYVPPLQSGPRRQAAARAV